VKNLLSILLLTLHCYNASGQYTGGAGKGSNVTAVPLLALGSISSSFSGGSNDGHSLVLVNGLPLAATSNAYSGGNEDGNSIVAAAGVSLGISSMYSGGIDDGMAKSLSLAVALSTASMFSGGTDDGFSTSGSLALALSAASAYAGGPDDGSAVLLKTSLSLSAPGMYAGNLDDGIGTVSSPAVNLGSLANMYSGGANDGFATVFAPAFPLVALPLAWEDFKVFRSGDDAILNWQVSNQRNNYRFDVERSYDGSDFSFVGFVKASGNTKPGEDYEYIDLDPARYCPAGTCATVFYRIRQLDFSGHYSFSSIKKLALGSAAVVANVYPNPASDKLIIRINTQGTAMPSYGISVYNAMGSSMLIHSGLTGAVQELNVRELPAGLYYLRLTLNDNTHTYQVTITH
jgi:hypothetical protein